MKKITKLLTSFLLLILMNLQLLAEDKTFDYEITYKTVDFAGEPRQAIAVNGKIPGPVLHAKEGDHITINVHNKLNEGTTIHWHGLLVPWDMDGVKGVNQDPIPPGETFKYQFTLRQSGTYWYHAHEGLQEQIGLYSGIIIDPLEPEPYKYTKDFVIVMSDWSNTHPQQIFRNLKKDGDYYSPRMPLQPSLLHFIKEYNDATPEKREELLMAYDMMQDMRMSIFDFSDVAYDAFLLNGRTKKNPWTSTVQVGDVVRLRFVGATGSTIYRIKVPGTKMNVVHMQGKDVVPHDVEDFTIAPGETLDVLVRIDEDKPYAIYAESSDTLGVAVGGLLTRADQTINYQDIKPFPSPGPIMMHHMMGENEGMNHAAMGHEERGSGNHMGKTKTPPSKEDHAMMGHKGMNHMEMGHDMSTNEPKSLTKGTKYQDLKSPYKTNDPSKPVEIIKMELGGFMHRFIWFINDTPEYLAKPILIEPGKRYRLVFTNNTMMHHPMHLHGHFMILRNGHGEYDPYLHTIDVAPGSTAVADFDADESGQWYFHCHHLYHMVAGMARVFRYSNFLEDYEAEHTKTEDESSLPDYVQHPAGHHAHTRLRATFLDLEVDPYRNVQKGTLNILVGSDSHKLQLYSEEAELRKGKVETADLDVFYWHPLSQFWTLKGGANYVYKPSHHPYWQPGFGIEGVMPYFIETNLRTYLHRGSVKFDLELARNSQLTDQFFIKTGIRGIMATKTIARDNIGSGLNEVEYMLRPYIMVAPGLSFFTELNYTRHYGPLKRILKREGESARERTLTIGFTTLF